MSKNKKSKEKKSKQEEKEKKRRRKEAWVVARKWIRRVLFALIAFVLIVLSLYWFPAELHYKVTETYSFHSDEAVEVNLAALLPTSGAYQTVTDPQIYWSGTGGTQTDGRLNVVRLNSEIGAGETITAKISYQVNLFQGPSDWIGEPIRSIDLLPSEAIQSEVPELGAQAAALATGQDDRDNVQNIFTWTAQYLDPGSEADTDQDALSTLTARTGDSLGYANLFAALSRAAEIPARTVTGRVIPELPPRLSTSQGLNAPLAFQAWNEVLIQDDWVIVDVFQVRSFLKHKLLGWVDGRHLVYDDVTNLEAVTQSLLTEAQAQGGWHTSGTTSLRYVAWSDSQSDSLTVTPSLIIQKTWDGRWLMMGALLVILFIIAWLIQSDWYGNESKSGRRQRD
jgi:hypothetical protein